MKCQNKDTRLNDGHLLVLIMFHLALTIYWILTILIEPIPSRLNNRIV
jgi:hypothetical protein